MKIFIKLMLLVLVGAVVAPMFIKGPDGEPIVTLQEVLPSSSSSESAYVSPSSSSSKLTTVYKWKDENGQWHFSDNQATGQNHETLKYNPKANIIQSLAKKEEPKDGAAAIPGVNGEYIAAVSRRSPRSQEEELEEELEGLDPEVVKRVRRALGSNNNANNNDITGGAGISLTTIPMSEIPKLIEQAKEVQALLDERNEELEKAISKSVR
ncbi:DUF4124 domain-containing protein [Litoribrevibacter euphylliae]|uniref:DUF4124 domain-containing protein n=1 Tax=Litoribrevibacter euphylliae TaxID=1834034 RepID=A0ABV7HEI4_9GAMM